MAVDMGRVIAEAIDSFYSIHTRHEQRRAFYGRVRAGLLNLQESIGTYAALAEAEDLLDPRQAGSPWGGGGASEKYRAGYKTGWRAAKENRKPNIPPERANDGDYVDGYTSGYKKSGIAQQALSHAQSGDLPAASELVQQHFVEPSSGFHMPVSGNENDETAWNRWSGMEQDPENKTGIPRSSHHALDALHKINQAVENIPDESDPHGMAGMNWKSAPEQGKHHVTEAPHPADLPLALKGKFKQTAFAKSKGAIKHGVGAHDIVKTGGDIFGRGEGGSDFETYMSGGGDERIARRGEAGAANRHEYEPESGAAPEPEAPEAPAPPAAAPQAAAPQATSPEASAPQAAPAQTPAEAPQSQAQHQIAQHIKTSLKPDLAAAAFGPRALAAHQAAGGDPNHPHHNPAIDEFMKTEHGHDPHAAIQHAHDLWTNQLENYLRKAASSHPDKKIRAQLAPKAVPITAPIPGDPYGRHGFVREDGTIDTKATKAGPEHKHVSFDPVERMMSAVRSKGGFQPLSGWIPATVREHPGLENVTFERIEAPDIARNAGLYDAARAANPQKVDKETGEPVESDADYEKRIKKIAHDTAATDPRFKSLYRKQVRPGSGAFDRTMRQVRDILHNAQNEHGDWLAHEGEADASVPEHPMWAHNYGLGLRNAQAEAGKTQRNLISQPVSGHPALSDFGRRKGEGTKQLGKRKKVKESFEGYVRTSTLANTVNHMLEIFEQWIEENVEVPSGNIDVVMEDIFSRIQPTYGKLFEVA